MNLVLRPQPPLYDKGFEDLRNRLLEIADSYNQKTNADYDINADGGRLILTDDNGVQYEVSIDVSGGLVVERLDGGSVNSRDAFGRTRVSDPLTLFDSQMQYNDSSLLFETVVVGTGAAAHNASEATVTMTVAAGGDSVVRQSRQYMRYKPGKSQLILVTALLGATPASDLIRRIGYFDANNGIYLKQTSAGLAWVRRTSTSGSMVEETVAQASWSEDVFSSLDPTKTLLAFIDMEWLGVGQARVGFFVNGAPITAHIFNATPTLTVPYVATANLPIRYEISSAATETGTMKQICAAVISEGGFEEEYGFPQARPSGSHSLTTSDAPILAIRPKATFNSIVNRGTLVPEKIEVWSDSNAIWKLYYRANVTTAASWTSQGANSIAEYDLSATAFTTTNAELIDGGYIAAGTSAKSGAEKIDIASRLPLVLDVAGANPIELVLVMATLTGTGVGRGIIRWRELY